MVENRATTDIFMITPTGWRYSAISLPAFIRWKQNGSYFRPIFIQVSFNLKKLLLFFVTVLSQIFSDAKVSWESCIHTGKYNKIDWVNYLIVIHFVIEQLFNHSNLGEGAYCTLPIHKAYSSPP